MLKEMEQDFFDAEMECLDRSCLFFSRSIVFHVTGALTKGDRRAASGADLTEFNFDTPYGRNALRAMYQSVCTVSRLLVLEPMVSLNSFRNIVKKFVFHCSLLHIFHCI